MARRGVRLLGFSVSAALWVVGCAGVPPGQSPSATPASKPTGDALDINPVNIRRLRGTFPPGFEVADANGSSSPTRFWGFGQDWSADPAQCASLADPLGGQGAAPRGLSGSGPGGIVYVVVASSPAPPVALDPAVVADCGRWSMASGRTTATVQLTAAPQIDGAATWAMDTETRTVVEGGTETDSQAHTAIAYLGDYLAFVTVVTDPGSTQPQLPPEFSSAFLVRTVRTLRG
jgi:hypothetical protein